MIAPETRISVYSPLVAVAQPGSVCPAGLP